MASLKRQMEDLAIRAHCASGALARVPAPLKNKILKAVALRMRRSWRILGRANAMDLGYGRSAGLSEAMMERLRLDRGRIEKMADSVADVMRLPEPIGRVLARWRRPNGLVISKVSVPLGVILIIYESRPNVTSECASLCLKSGNAVILRGGREAIRTNRAIAEIYRSVLADHHQPQDAVKLVPVVDRRAIDALLRLNRWIQLVIPRGGESLIRRVSSRSRIPVIKHDKGICHVYVDRSADLSMALKVAFNAKCQRYSVCNTMETLLIHRDIASRFLDPYAELLRREGCEIRGDEHVRRFVPDAAAAKASDWSTEYLDRILSIRVVRDVSQAIDHIRRYGSQHTDAIVARDRRAIRRFVDEVDSSSVMVNASTRFSDGNEYGFGAEIGISTEKIHARGPMGLQGLTSYKYVVQGRGHVRT
jgi:glutamate-5-semialdehyde dehydrogenase